jgi:hypothetical protein
MSAATRNVSFEICRGLVGVGHVRARGQESRGRRHSVCVSRDLMGISDLFVKVRDSRFHGTGCHTKS